MVTQLEQNELRLPNYKDIFGVDEKSWFHCKPEKTIAKLVEEKVIPEGSTIRIITPDFSKGEWNPNTHWYKFAKRKLDDGVKIKAYGGPYIDADKAVEDLMKSGMECLRLMERERKLTECYLTVDNPMLIWAVSEHRSPDAFGCGCIYADKPFESAWNDVDNYFRNVESRGNWI